MISKEDCIAFCGLTREEVDAIAEHEHLDDVGATALADYLLHRHHGPERIRDMIVDDLRKALSAGHVAHAAELTSALYHFLKDHPEAAKRA